MSSVPDAPATPPPALGAMIVRVQSRFIRAAPLPEVFNPLLTDLLEFTGSGYGFVAEACEPPAGGAAFLRMLALTDISWDDATRDMVARHHGGQAPMEFHQLDSLYGQPLRSGQPLIANHPASDPRRAGLPPGHPPLNAFMAVPLFHGGELVGVVGLANRPGGYSEADVAHLQPLLASVAAIIDAVRLERGRREAERALRDTFDLAAVGISHVALDGRFLRVNPRLCELLGLSAEQLLALRFQDITHPDDVAADEAQLHDLLAGRIPRYTMEKRYRLPQQSGAGLWAQLTVALVRDSHGRPDYLVSVVEDIGARKQNEAHVLAVQAAERANAAKSEFLSRMSHELRTPLNAVLGFAQLLRLNATHPLQPSQLLKVQRIEQAGAHLLDMINDVLDLSHIESGELMLVSRSVPLGAVLDEVVPLLGPAAAARGVQVHVAEGAALHTVRADPLRLRQVLLNLLSNAIKYNRPQGNVRLHCVVLPEPGWLRLAVEDTGPGLSAEQQAHLYEPFNRLGAERSEVEGTGMGLVISERLVRGMGGRMSVHSVPGQGSVFAVDLPLGEPPTPAASHTRTGPAAAVTGAAAGESSAPPPFDVLYAEGDALNVALMRSVLALRPHINLRVTHSGYEAWAQAQAAPPHVLLLDLELSDMPGLDLVRRWAATPALATRPVLALTTDASAEAVQRATEAGVQACLSKPLDVSALLAALDRWQQP